MMTLARTAALMIGVCGHAILALTPSASGQDLVGRPVERVESAAAFLNPLFVNQWIGLNADKSCSGKLVSFGDTGAVLPRSAVQVALTRSGKTVAQSVTDTDGMFQFRDIAPGSYSFVAQSDYCYATFGIHVLPVGSGSPSSFEVCVTSVSAAAARGLMRDNWVPSESDAPEVFTKDPLAGSRAISAAPKVMLQNGDLVGQVSRSGRSFAKQDLTGNVAHVFKAGRSIAAAPIGQDGKFKIMNLVAGIYDLVVVGEDGSAFIGFEAVGPMPVATNRSSNSHLVSRQDISNSLNIELADPVVIEDEPEDVPPMIVSDSGFDAGFGPPLMGGGFPARGFGGGGFGGGGGGGFGGGGGGGFGGGGAGIGGLLGIAGLGVGVAALSQNDDFNPIPATIIAP